ncbi:MAG: ATP synthase F1 subunit gamma [Acidobacteria bacterium]|nr:ATP synthase F1 subunit gamma [Acidobacteriota bacterium]
MPSLIDMRRRIRSVRNTQQITKAMKMISAARLRKAQERAFNARPYSGLLKEVLTSLAARATHQPGEEPHPLLRRRPQERIVALVLSGDRGLCGAFNTNILRAAERFLIEHRDQKPELILAGRKARDYFRRRNANMKSEHVGIFTRLDYSHARAIATEIITAYSEETTDAVYLIYNEFKSVIAQRIVVEQLLPLPEFKPQGDANAPMVDYIYEQSPEDIYGHLLPRYVEVQVYRALLESGAAEHAARMTAMDSATNNAGDMIDSLTLRMNRIRQAAITKEIIEVVSGAAAAQ